jgi:hypothetical protein
MDQNRDPIACPKCGVVSHILNVKGIYTCIGPESCPVYTFEYNHKKNIYGPTTYVGPTFHDFGASATLRKRTLMIGVGRGIGID